MIHNIYLSIALPVAAWCIWVRRQSWRGRQDASLTLSVGLVAVGLFLAAPFENQYAGLWLYNIFGVGHLNNWLGQVCFITACAAVNYAIVSRLVPDNHVDKIMRKVEYPNAFAAGCMIAALFIAPKNHHPPHKDFLAITPSPYLCVYWTAFLTVLTYQLVYMIRILLVLRTDPRSRFSADCFIIGAAGGIADSALTAVHLAANVMSAPTMWVLLSLPGAFVAAGTAVSWRHRAPRQTRIHIPARWVPGRA